MSWISGKSNDPVDITLPDGVLLENGTLFVVLPTLRDLEAIWNAKADRFAYSAEGVECRKPYRNAARNPVIGPSGRW